LQVARRTENQKIKLSSARKPLLKHAEKDALQKRNKSKVFYLIADNILEKHIKKICIDKSKVQNPNQKKGGF
jgi:ribosomal protein L18